MAIQSELSAETSEPVPLVLPPGKSSSWILCANLLQPPSSQLCRRTATDCDQLTSSTNCDGLLPDPYLYAWLRPSISSSLYRCSGTKAEVIPMGTQHMIQDVLKSSNETWGQNPHCQAHRWKGTPGGMDASPLRFHFLVREKLHSTIH